MDQIAFQGCVPRIAVDSGLQHLLRVGQFLCRFEQSDIAGQDRERIGRELMPVFVGGNCPVRVAGRDLDAGVRLDDFDVCWEFVSQFSRSRCSILLVVLQEV